MEQITYNISQEIPAEGNPGIRIKSIAFTIEMPDGKVCNIVLNNTQERLVSLKTKTYGQFCISLSDIVMICPTDKADFAVEGNSNNKAIFFTNRRPDIINNFSASHDIQDKLGIPPNEFVCVNRGWYVNRTHIELSEIGTSDDTDNDRQGSLILVVEDQSRNEEIVPA